jgi:hypothetical protein
MFPEKKPYPVNIIAKKDEKRKMAYVKKEESADQASVHKSTLPVTPAESSDNRRENEGQNDREPGVVAVVPRHDLVLPQIAHVDEAGSATVLEDHPADVRPEKSLGSSVRVEIGVGVSVVRAVAAAPIKYRALDGSCACRCKEILERLRSSISSVRPQSVETLPQSKNVQISFSAIYPLIFNNAFTCGDSQARIKIIQHRPDSRGPRQRSRPPSPDSKDVKDEKTRREIVVDVLDQVGPSDWRQRRLALEVFDDPVVVVAKRLDSLVLRSERVYEGNVLFRRGIGGRGRDRAGNLRRGPLNERSGNESCRSHGACVGSRERKRGKKKGGRRNRRRERETRERVSGPRRQSDREEALRKL